MDHPKDHSLFGFGLPGYNFNGRLDLQGIFSQVTRTLRSCGAETTEVAVTYALRRALRHR